jgi:hypothetical protein
MSGQAATIPVSEAIAAKLGAMQTWRRAEAHGLRQWQVSDGRHFAAHSPEEAETLARLRPLTMAGRVRRGVA